LPNLFPMTRNSLPSMGLSPNGPGKNQ
jgi:hypothetical protein